MRGTNVPFCRSCEIGSCQLINTGFGLYGCFTGNGTGTFMNRDRALAGNVEADIVEVIQIYRGRTTVLEERAPLGHVYGRSKLTNDNKVMEVCGNGRGRAVVAIAFQVANQQAGVVGICSIQHNRTGSYRVGNVQVQRSAAVALVTSIANERAGVFQCRTRVDDGIPQAGIDVDGDGFEPGSMANKANVAGKRIPGVGVAGVDTRGGPNVGHVQRTTRAGGACVHAGDQRANVALAGGIVGQRNGAGEVHVLNGERAIRRNADKGEQTACAIRVGKRLADGDGVSLAVEVAGEGMGVGRADRGGQGDVSAQLDGLAGKSGTGVDQTHKLGHFRVGGNGEFALRQIIEDGYVRSNEVIVNRHRNRKLTAGSEMPLGVIRKAGGHRFELGHGLRGHVGVGNQAGNCSVALLIVTIPTAKITAGVPVGIVAVINVGYFVVGVGTGSFTQNVTGYCIAGLVGMLELTGNNAVLNVAGHLGAAGVTFEVTDDTAVVVRRRASQNHHAVKQAVGDVEGLNGVILSRPTNNSAVVVGAGARGVDRAAVTAGVNVQDGFQSVANPTNGANDTTDAARFLAAGVHFNSGPNAGDVDGYNAGGGTTHLRNDRPNVVVAVGAFTRKANAGAGQLKVGNGGGLSGTNGAGSSAGTQSSGYKFGQGQNGRDGANADCNCEGNGGGGGGYYGGGSHTKSGAFTNASGSGGSGYIGGVSNGNTNTGVRQGNGYAKITFLGL